MATRQTIVGGAVVSGFLALAFVLGTRPLPAYSPVAAPAAAGGGEKATASVGVMGASSCSGRGCHGSCVPAPEEKADASRIRRNESVVWILHDRHASAFAVLKGERSQQIARNLNETRNGQLIPAHENDRCLACHATPQAVGHGGELARLFDDGVGCESCHGAAARWIGPHTAKGWKDISAKDKEEKYGFVPTTDLAKRAQTCAGCHVGAPATDQAPVRDMNHDLIAAGHPRLNFEFSAFQANMPHHWRAKDDPAKEWAVGEVAVAQSALELLVDRATRAGADRAPWPEFAEYDCFACHHDLQGKSWRQERGYGERKPGSLPWGTWYYSMPRTLAASGLAGDKDVVSSLDKLEQLMQQPYPDPGAVVQDARQAAARMQGLLGKLPQTIDPKAVVKEYRSELTGKRAANRADWDAIGQLYLSLAALNQAKPDKNVDAVLKDLRARLNFPGEENARHEYDSPKGKDYPAAALSDILKPLSP